MTGELIEGPPRPLRVGDIIVGYHHRLGEWTAAQILGSDSISKTVEVLELDWSGPEPSSLGEISPLRPLRLTHHAHKGRLSSTGYHWILPKSYRVLGNLPLVHTELSHSLSFGWDLGLQLALQRSWDAGSTATGDPVALDCSAQDFENILVGATRPDILELSIKGITRLDCARLVTHFPRLQKLSLWGNLGNLQNAGKLRSLTGLKKLMLLDLFGMTKDDVLEPEKLPHLESLWLRSIPKDYATVMRKRWKKEIPTGVDVMVQCARADTWVAENRDNPLRDWDGREHIPAAAYKKSVQQYKATRDAVQAACTHGDDLPALEAIGAAFAVAFNKLDAKRGFIETEEREELFGVLTQLAQLYCTDATAASAALWEGAETERDW